MKVLSAGYEKKRTDEQIKNFASRDSVYGNEKDLVVLWRCVEGVGRVIWNLQFDANIGECGAECG